MIITCPLNRIIIIIIVMYRIYIYMNSGKYVVMFVETSKEIIIMNCYVYTLIFIRVKLGSEFTCIF